MSTMPIFAPNAKPGDPPKDVPIERSKEAIAAGGQPAVLFQPPGGGKPKYVPAKFTQDAVKLGGKMLPYEQQEIKHPGFWHGLASDLIGIAEGIPSAVSGISPIALPGKIAEMSTEIAAGDIARRNEGRSTAYRIASPVVQNVTGANVRGMEESANEGDVGGVLGHAAAVPTAIGIAAGAPKAVEVSKGPMTRTVRTAVRAANVALEKAPASVGTVVGGGAGAGIGGMIGGPVGAKIGGEIGGAVGYGLGKEILPRVKLPGEGFGLPNRVLGGPADAPAYQSTVPALKQAIDELGPKASVRDIAKRAGEIQAAAQQAIGVEPYQMKPGVPIKNQGLPAGYSAPGATEVKATTRSARGFEGGGASETSEPQPRTPAPQGESTAVDSYRYDPAKQEIHVTGKNGRTYVYGEVTPEQAQMFDAAESKGMAWKAIKDNNPYVAKIIDGKRVPIKRAAAFASPDDLTPLLEESLRQVQGSSATKTPATWREYTAQNMSQAMKETGSHGAAMKKMSADWKALQSKQ